MVQLSRWNRLANFFRDRFGRTFLAIVFIVLSMNSANAEPQFPYVAYVTQPDAYVRSGPGQRYYPTQQLQQGYAVEVYRHDGDRWCAIRPPEGSYSWVAAHQVNQLGQGVAEVSAERTVTRVGSLLSTQRSAVQVLLPRGEQIKVLDALSADDPRWLRVAAPAGEFRWIAADDLSAQPPVETTSLAQQAAAWTEQSDASSESLQQPAQKPNAFDHLRESPAVSASKSTADGFIGSPYNPPAIVDSNAMDVVAGSPAELQLAEAISPVVGQAGSSPPRIRIGDQTAAQVPATPRIAELELRLSEIIVRTPAEWDFEPLKAEANSLLVNTDLSGERSNLRDVLEKISRFERVQERYSMTPIAVPQPESLAVSVPIEAPQKEFTGRTSRVRELLKRDFGEEVTTTADLANGIETPLYDAVGQLKPVVSKREKAPRYALVDEKGDVVAFVTPTPDLNLQPYLGQRIGVHGTRGYMQEFQRSHVTASRITPIEGPIRR